MADNTPEEKPENSEAVKVPATKKRMTDAELEKFMSTARSRFKRACDWDSHNVEKGVKNLKFVYIEGAQWEEEDRNKRKGRPTLESNMLIQYIEQIVGEERQSRPWIKVVPRSSDATHQAAETRQGYINDILYRSNAESIFDYAIEMLAAGNRGAWRVCTRYTEENPFVQEIYLERIPNPYVVKMAPCKSEVYADAPYAFVQETMSEEEYIDRYGDKFVNEAASWIKEGKGGSLEGWYDKGKTVTIAEYFWKEKTTKTFALLDNGEFMEKEAAEEKLANYRKAAKEDPTIVVPEIKKTREIDSYKVKRCIINGLDILEDQKISVLAGEHIPVVIANGKDINIEGKTYIRSAVEKAFDDQRMKNFWKSHLAEIIKTQPKAPITATAKHVAGYEQLYRDANDQNLAVLPYNVDPDAPMTKPERMQPMSPPAALFQQIAMCDADIAACIGIGKAGLGQVDKVYSGEALGRMAKPGDNVTLGYLDNLARAVLHTAKIINSMVPEVLDTAREIPQRHENDKATYEPINTTISAAVDTFQKNPQRFSHVDKGKIKQYKRMMSDPAKGPHAPYNDMTKGAYEVQMTVGPQYSTLRQESAKNFRELLREWPELKRIGGDVILSKLDFEGTDELAQRIRQTLPPHIAPPKEGEPPRMPPPPSPQVLLMQAKVMTEKIKAAREGLKMQNEQKDGQKEIREEVLQVLQQLFAVEHPADQTMPQEAMQ